MENRRCESGVDLWQRFKEFYEVVNTAGAAGSNHRNRYRFANGFEHWQIKTAFDPVGVDTVDDNFSRAKFRAALDPLYCIKPGILSATLCENVKLTVYTLDVN